MAQRRHWPGGARVRQHLPRSGDPARADAFTVYCHDHWLFDGTDLRDGDIEFIASRMFGEVTADTLARCRYGNAVMMVNRPYGPDGGEVVVIGASNWMFGLADDPAVSQVIANVLDRCLPD